MAVVFQQTDEVSACEPMAACAPPASLIEPIEPPLVDAAMQPDGTPGSVEETMDIAAGTSAYKAFFQSGAVGQADWPAGNWTVDLRVSTAQNNIAWTGVWICRIDDTCGTVASVGSETTSTDISAGGLFSKTVSGDATSGLDTERVYVVCEFTNSHSMTSRTVGITPSETVTSPIPEPEAVTVTTGTASNVTDTTATLNGSLDELAGATSADVWFDWRAVGATAWNTTPVQTMTATGPFSADLTGLTATTDYEFRAQASTTNASSTGATATFTTKEPPRVVAGTVTLNGSGVGGATVHILDTSAATPIHLATVTTEADGGFRHETYETGELDAAVQYDDGTTKYNSPSHHSIGRVELTSLTVATTETYTIPAGTTESYSSAQIDGTLVADGVLDVP